MNNPVIKRGEKVNYTCLRSGKCCSSGPNVTLTVYDVCRIARFLNTSWREIAGRYVYVVVADYIPVILLRGINSRCVFLKTINGVPTCTIYPARPMRCRLYPFIPVSPTDKSTLELSTRCPGVGKGPLQDPPWSELEEYLVEVRKHYSTIYNLVFEKGLEPVKALEKALDDICGLGQPGVSNPST